MKTMIISRKKVKEMKFLHDTFQNKMKLVVFVKIKEKLWHHSKDNNLNLNLNFLNNLLKETCVKCTCLHTTPYKNGKMYILIGKHI